MNWLRVLIAFSGLVVIVSLPWIWPGHLVMAGVLVVALIPWAIWLMLEYLRWARRLGK